MNRKIKKSKRENRIQKDRKQFNNLEKDDGGPKNYEKSASGLTIGQHKKRSMTITKLCKLVLDFWVQKKIPGISLDQ